VGSQRVYTEIYYGEQWHDRSTDVRQADGVVIAGGSQDEGAAAKPSSCALTFDNRSGWAHPTNPPSPLYDSGGRYTPIVVYLEGPDSTADTFDGRTLTTGWGSTTTGAHPWNLATIGSSTATDWSVTGGVARHYIDSAVEARICYLNDITLTDIDVTLVWSSVTATGGALEPAGVLYRMQDVNTFGMVRVSLTTAGAIQLQCYRADTGAQIGGDVTIPGATHTGTGQTWKLRVATLGRVVMAAVLLAANTQTEWHAIWDDPSDVRSGGIGIRSGRGAGNTSTTNPQCRFHDLTITDRDVRFSGEVISWAPKTVGNFPTSAWLSGVDPGKGDAYTEVQAAGILHRLNAGRDPVTPSLERTIIASSPRAYWPMTDSAGAAGKLASGIGGSPINLIAGGIDYRVGALGATLPDTIGSIDGRIVNLDGYFDFPTAANTVWTGGFAVNGFDSNLNLALQFVGNNWAGSGTSRTDWNIAFPGDGAGGGKIQLTRLTYTGAGSSSALLIDTTSAVFDGGPHYVTLTIGKSGSDLTYVLSVDGASVGSGTVASAEFVTPKRAFFNAFGTGLADTRWQIGYLSVHAADVAASLWTAYSGHPDESPATRYARLCLENDIPYVVSGADSTTTMGPQGSKPLVELLQECADTEDGILAEPRGWTGLVLVTRAALYTATPRFDLPYAGGGVRVAAPVIDTKDTANDVTVSNANGDEFRAEQTTGPAGITSVGRITAGPDVNYGTPIVGQLARRASWELAKGQLLGSRWPRIDFDFVQSPDLIATVGRAEVGDLGIMSGLEADDVAQIIRAYTERIGSGTRVFGVMGTPATLWMATAYSAAAARYDAADSVLSAGVTATATSLTVATGPISRPWLTGSNSIPIMVGGELMTATTISGATSPQTFTVVRSVNGVVKAHAAGAEVHVQPVPRYAY
jgi:hypothetical protein